MFCLLVKIQMEDYRVQWLRVVGLNQMRVQITALYLVSSCGIGQVNLLLFTSASLSANGKYNASLKGLL